ncbi:hypothetical protein VTO73DRAFT_8749 [Trametes versicolor]
MYAEGRRRSSFPGWVIRDRQNLSLKLAPEVARSSSPLLSPYVATVPGGCFSRNSLHFDDLEFNIDGSIYWPPPGVLGREGLSACCLPWWTRS